MVGVSKPGGITVTSGSGIGTGSEQTVPHSLGAIPRVIAITCQHATAYTYESTAADATNLYITASSSAPYDWYCIL